MSSPAHRTIALAFALLAATSLTGRAIELVTATQFELPPDAALEQQTALYATDATLNGAVLDDLFLLAQKAKITGPVSDALWILAGDATLSGVINGHVRTLAQSVLIEGELKRDLTSAGSSLRLATNAVVEGRVDALVEQATLEGEFRSDVRIWASSITLAGTYGGNVRLSGRDIVVLPGTRIAGDLIYSSPKEIFLDRSVVLGGKLSRHLPEAAAPSTWQDYLQLVILYAVKAASALLAGLALLALFPHLIERSVRNVQRSLWRCMGLGGVGLIGVPIVAVILALSIIGLPLAIMALALWGTLLYLGKVIIAIHIGTLLLRMHGTLRFSQITVILLLGIVIIYIATALPGIGASLALLIAILGFGALLSGLLQGRLSRRVHHGEVSHESDEPPLKSNGERKE
ncbi:MAG: hypothetical protein M9963_02165 [Kiritimatiellae bacterium]|nr:hypothetical protein [Kiritimatiellia bacterium]MCO5060799.1 hypothetical protein [Kiritimatiellia bacterium]MCO5068811.1 hypothetical protein [Kiritimatiellia bacterium]MCO6399842.1 hypothetical protein [Verrucomicrobiota bacterium]